jgi:ABC-type uncharacterized transport system substrate-binding protein
MRKVFAGVVLFVSLSALVHAHPHIFVKAKAGFHIDSDNHLQALRIVWRYDAFTTLFLFDTLDLDSDGDGVLNDDDRATIVAGETQWPSGYNGDVHLTVAGTPLKLTKPQNASADMIDGQITVSFDLPLATPADMSGQRASLRLFDPAYYYAYSVSTDAGDQTTETPCEVIVIPFKPDKTEAETLWTLSRLSREETPSDPNIGARFADEILLTCN